MLDIKQIALEVARMNELMGPKDTFAFTKDRLVDFATRFLAAITEKAEPVAEIIGANSGGRDVQTIAVEGKLIPKGTKLFTHPAIEPAPQITLNGMTPYQFALNELYKFQEKTGCDTADEIGAAPLPEFETMTIGDKTYKIMGGYLIYEITPLPDDVAQMVQRLHLLQDEGYTFSGEAAEMIERLARQVPPDCVVVPRELLGGLCKYGHLHTVEGVAYSQGSHRELLGRASDLIAAGEVKP